MKRMNKFAALCLSGLMVFNAGFGWNVPAKVNAAETSTEANTAETKTIIDGYGEEVEVPSEIKSIVGTMWPLPSVILP